MESRGMNKKIFECMLTLVCGVLFFASAQAQAQNYSFTSGSLAGTRIAARQAIGEKTCAGLTENRLMAIMLSVPVWELNGGVVDRSPSPMTLSRWDGWANAKNQPLYSFQTLDGDKRAHWNPGVGLWQLDTFPATLHLSHAERMDTRAGGVYIARVLRDAFCAGEASLKTRLRGTWFACQTNDRCFTTYTSMYTPVGDVLRVTGTAGTSQSGGTMLTRCRWGANGVPFSCYWVNIDRREGYMDVIDLEGTGARTPLAAGFMSFSEGGFKRAVWLLASGLGSEIQKHVPTTQDARAVNNWVRDSALQVETCSGANGCWTTNGVNW
jgi:hypothetical protein